MCIAVHNPRCRFVDVYTLSSQNLTQKYSNATFHHSRLMGVSDIENAVSAPPRDHCWRKGIKSVYG